MADIRTGCTSTMASLDLMYGALIRPLLLLLLQIQNKDVKEKTFFKE
jgi:hypothetical protein